MVVAGVRWPHSDEMLSLLRAKVVERNHLGFRRGSRYC